MISGRLQRWESGENPLERSVSIRSKSTHEPIDLLAPYLRVGQISQQEVIPVH